MFNQELGGREAGGPLNYVWRRSFGEPPTCSNLDPDSQVNTQDPRIADSPCIPSGGCFKGMMSGVTVGGGADWSG